MGCARRRRHPRLALTRLDVILVKEFDFVQKWKWNRIGGSSSLGDVVVDAAQVAEAFKFNRRIFYAFPFPF